MLHEYKMFYEILNFSYGESAIIHSKSSDSKRYTSKAS